jgi:hypothetical protein
MLSPGKRLMAAYDARAMLLKGMQSRLDDAKEANRSLTDSEAAEFDGNEAALRALDEQIASLKKQQD